MPSLALTRLDGSKFSNMKPSSDESVLRRLLSRDSGSLDKSESSSGALRFPFPLVLRYACSPVRRGEI